MNEVTGTWTTHQEPQETAKYKWAWFGISQIDGTELCHFPLGWKWRRGWIEMEETNGRFTKHKTLALQRNTMTKFIKEIW